MSWASFASGALAGVTTALYFNPNPVEEEFEAQDIEEAYAAVPKRYYTCCDRLGWVMRAIGSLITGVAFGIIFDDYNNQRFSPGALCLGFGGLVMAKLGQHIGHEEHRHIERIEQARLNPDSEDVSLAELGIAPGPDPQDSSDSE